MMLSRRRSTATEVQPRRYLRTQQHRGQAHEEECRRLWSKVLLPAMTRLGQTIKHLHCADEAHGEWSSIKRIIRRCGDNGDDNNKAEEHKRFAASVLGAGFKDNKDRPRSSLPTEQGKRLARDQAPAGVKAKERELAATQDKRGAGMVEDDDMPSRE